MIPGENDAENEIDAMTRWIVTELGPDVPVHFSAFHPDYKMLDRPPTPPATLRRAREIARRNGVRYAYTGNVHDRDGDTTVCHACGEVLVVRDWYELVSWSSTTRGVARPAGRPAPGSSTGRRGAGVGSAGRCGWRTFGGPGPRQ